MKYTGLNLPAHCTMIEEHELHEIHGGGSILSFIQYLLSGLPIHLGRGADNGRSDPPVSPTPPGWNTTHTSVDTSHSGGYGGWDASFNLGSFFGALLRLFS